VMNKTSLENIKNILGVNYFNDFNFQKYLFDDYMNQEISNRIQKLVGKEDNLEILLVYLENNGSTAITLSELGSVTVVESSEIARFESIFSLQSNLSKKKNIKIQFSPEPFSFIKPNSFIVVRADNIFIVKLIEDLYKLGFDNRIMFIGNPQIENYNEEIWKKLPIYGYDYSEIDFSKDKNLSDKNLFLQMIKNRVEQIVPIRTMLIRRNPKPTIKLSKYVNDITNQYKKSRDLNYPDEINRVLSSFANIVNQYLPPNPRKSNLLQMTNSEFQTPLYYGVVNQIIDMIESNIGSLNGKFVHHFWNMSSVSVLPLALRSKGVYVYSNYFTFDRIYNENTEEIQVDNFYISGLYDNIKKNITEYPQISYSDNVSNISNIQVFVDEFNPKEGDLIFSFYPDPSMLDLLLAKRVNNVYAAFIHPLREKVEKIKTSKDIELIQTKTIGSPQFFEQVLKETSFPRIAKEYIQDILKNKLYELSIELYVFHPSKTFKSSLDLEKDLIQETELELIETNKNDILVLNQDLFQSMEDFEVLTDICKIIIDNFPTLKPEAVHVVGKGIMNKIKDGISYGPELEAIIKVVLPKVLEQL
jgi:hypothetical protein